ncbi:unnamed protein product, partial [marine sediment metagenome]
MTVKISQQKVSRLLKYYFAGMTQPVIAQKLGIDQSSVSLYAKRFSERAAMIGLLAAAKEYNVYKEVRELRNLSVELQQLNLTSEDARDGVRIIKDFNRLRVPRDQHTELIQVCKKVTNPGFIDASMTLIRIEVKEKISYEEAVTKYNKIVSQLPLKQSELTRTQTQLNSLNRSVANKNEELQNINAQARQSRKYAEANRETLERNYEARRQQLRVKLQEVEDVAQVKAELSKDNLDIAIMVKLVKEYGHGTQPVNGIVIRRAIEGHHSLEKSKEAINNEVSLQNKKNAQLQKLNSELKSDNARSIASIKVVNNSLDEKRLEYSQLTLTVMEHSHQYDLFKGFLAMIGSSPLVTSSIKTLIASLKELIRPGWYSSKSNGELRDLFIHRVFGDYLQSFRCDHCGSRFMVSEGTNKIYFSSSYNCPKCHWTNWVKPDDSFLKALVSERKLENIHYTELLVPQNEILRPFKVLLTIPCEICGKLITDWTEDKAKRIAMGMGWGHEECWKTLLG